MIDSLRGLHTAWDVWKVGRIGEPAITSRQRARLADLVRFARESSPYYRRIYKGLPARITDRHQLPAVTKPELMENFDGWVTDPEVTREGVEAFVSDLSLVGQGYLGRYLVFTTAGTTGEPAILVQDRRTLAIIGALNIVRVTPFLLSRRDLWRMLQGGGRAASVWSTGGHFGGVSMLKRQIRLRPSRAKRLRIFSALSPLDELVWELNSYRPVMLSGYASVLDLLAREQQARRLNIHPVLAISGGEKLTYEARERIESAFGAKVFNGYGSSEFVAIAYDCGRGSLHVHADWVILEPVDENYDPVPLGEPSHTVLLTNLANRVQPIIRYDLGDRVVVKPSPCSCGSPLPAITVEGRTNDALSFETLDGRTARLLPLALGAVVEETSGVRRFQAIKTAPETLSVRVEPMPGADERKVWEAVVRRLKEYLSAQGLPRVAVERDTEQPAPDPVSGKFRQVWAEV